MRWEEIEAGWQAMTRRVRADWPGAVADIVPDVAFLAPAQAPKDPAPIARVTDGPMR